MKGVFIAILFVVAALSGANASRLSSADATASTKNPSWLWWPHRPIAPVPSSNPDVKKCLGDLPGLKSCFQQVSESSYETQAISFSSECCTAVQQVSADCSSMLFYKLHSLFFQYVLKQCSASPPA